MKMKKNLKVLVITFYTYGIGHACVTGKSTLMVYFAE